VAKSHNMWMMATSQKRRKEEKKTPSLRVNPTKDLKYIGNKFLQN
jgi:hypothetical protein